MDTKRSARRSQEPSRETRRPRPPSSSPSTTCSRDAPGRSVAAMLGVPKRTELPTLDILPIEPPDRMAELALELRERIGTERFKLKIDADVAAGLERVAAVRAALPEAMLVVDANGAWDVATARSAVEKLARYQVAVVEQPVPGHRVDELAAVRRDSPIPIAADESARPEFVDWLIATRACDLVNLKITREGGFRPALAVAESARAAGIQVIVGSVVQTGLVDAACAHLFAVLPEVAYNESGKAPALASPRRRDGPRRGGRCGPAAGRARPRGHR